MALSKPKTFDDYLIVTFADDNQPRIISSNWLDGTSCSVWPPYQDETRRRTAAKKMEEAQDDWYSYPIKEKYEYETDDWDACVRKFNRLKNGKPVESTDPENLGRSKRSKRSPVRYCPVESEQKSYKRIRTLEDDCDASDETGVEETSFRTKHAVHRIPDPPRMREPGLPRIYHKPSRNSSSETTPPARVTQQQEQAPRTSVSVPVTMLASIIKMLEDMKVDIKGMKKMMKQQMAANTTHAEEGGPISISIDRFPLTSMDALHKLEEDLQDQQFQSKLVKYLHVFNGRDAKEEIHSILAGVLSKDVQVKFNLTGKGKLGKRSFQALRLFEVLKVAITQRFPDVTEKTIRDKVSNFLGEAGDRNGGRREREVEKRRQEQNEVEGAEQSHDAESVILSEL